MDNKDWKCPIDDPDCSEGCCPTMWHHNHDCPYAKVKKEDCPICNFKQK